MATLENGTPPDGGKHLDRQDRSPMAEGYIGGGYPVVSRDAGTLRRAGAQGVGEMTADTKLDAIAVWKNAALIAYQRAFVGAVLARGHASTDDIPDDQQPASTDRQSIPGNAVRALRKAHVIEYADAIHRPEDGIYHGRRISRRPDAKGREIRVYRATATTREWAERNQVPWPADGQMRLAI